MVDRIYDLVNYAEKNNNEARQTLNQENKEKYEQFFTGKETAIHMAKLFKPSNKRKIRIIDPGAGTGILSVSLLNIIFETWKYKPKSIEVIAYEIDPSMNMPLSTNYNYCKRKFLDIGIKMDYKIINENYMLTGHMNKKVDYIILNPPYKKIDGNSDLKKILVQQKIVVPNEYAAFVLISKNLLSKGGGLVAITPRSFCNGQYFEKFRKELIKDSTFKDIHIFETRNSLFREDQVLQETVVYHIVKKGFNFQDKVNIHHSSDEKLCDLVNYEIDYAELIHPNDGTHIIRVLKSERDKAVAEQMEMFSCELGDLNISVSTGPFVDFREKEELKLVNCTKEAYPYIFPEHFDVTEKNIQWPKENIKKYNYIVAENKNISKFRPNGNYVLVKRITAKEEQRRIVASVLSQDFIPELSRYKFFAFDNKINYFHINRNGLSKTVALGLCLYLNSTLVDLYFRLFSGHTQVNVSDLQKLKYPSVKQLIFLGNKFNNIYASQEKIDYYVSQLYKVQ